MTLKELGLRAEANEVELKAHWRQLAAVHHPDRGGDPTEFARLRAQYETALLEVAQPLVCSECGGRGFVPMMHGFFQARGACKTCCGAGTVQR